MSRVPRRKSVVDYRVEYSPEAQRQLDKLDRAVASRIIKLMDWVQELPDPRAIGDALCEYSRVLQDIPR